ncbi:MAG: FAD-dependent monooxygenase [Chlamydiales bacterium]|nr:FAD-dependent monooxygenase [Chlamydiales bacterium]
MSQKPIQLFKSRVALIAGAGPTGLTLACELARRGIDLRLIEPLERRTMQSRALGIQPRTLETFQKMGIIEPFLKHGLPVRQLNVYRNGKKLLEVNLREIDSPFPYILSIPQAETERILTEHLESFGKKIKRGVKLSSIRNGCATLSQKTGEEELIAPTWIIGCDGAHSSVRHSLNVPFKGTKFSEVFILADLTVEGPYAHDEAHLFFSDEGLFGFVPLPQPNQFRLIAPFPEDSKITAETLDLDFFEKMARQRIGFGDLHIKNPTWISLFHVHRRIVSQMRFENIFLAGDAAHIHSPAGGQGLNMSVQDAYNLAWKLAFVESGRAPDSLLNSYQKERHPVAKRVLFSTTLVTEIITSPVKWTKDVASFVMRLLLKTPARMILLRGMAGISIRYKGNSIRSQSFWDRFWCAPKVGVRAPDAELADRTKLFDALRQKDFLLLTFAPLPAHIKEKLESLGIATLLAEGETVRKVYSAKEGSLFLIRPDGYISYRSRTLNQQHLLDYLSAFCYTSAP